MSLNVVYRYMYKNKLPSQRNHMNDRIQEIQTRIINQEVTLSCIDATSNTGNFVAATNLLRVLCHNMVKELEAALEEMTPTASIDEIKQARVELDNAKNKHSAVGR